MQLLILGGTAWLGRTVAEAALRRGHAVTCLARGTTAEAPAGVRFVRADRQQPQAFAALAGCTWDAVIDVSRQPGQVRDAAAALHGRSACFVFVSTVSIYRDNDEPGQDETAALLPAFDGDAISGLQHYGEAKVACEQHVLRAFGAGRSLVVRAGLIGGPGDPTDRSGYWPARFAAPAAADGRVLVPEAPDVSTQMIDVRDLADWLVLGAARGLCGVFNATGWPVPLEEHLHTARAVAGHRGALARAQPGWLAEHGVRPWGGPRSLPLWLPMPGHAGFGTRDSSAARSAGLSTRPLAETLADTLAWERARPAPQQRLAGLADDDERALLAALP